MSDFFETAKGLATPENMGGVATIFKTIGGVQAGQAARRAGEQARTAAEFEAAQLDQQSGQVVAAAQREAIEQRRRARLAMSRGLAVAAASGAGASDPTIANLIAGLGAEGEYRAGTEMYEGEERARQLRTGADARRYEGGLVAQRGRDRQAAYQLDAFGGLSLYGKYGKGGPWSKRTESGLADPDVLDSWDI